MLSYRKRYAATAPRNNTSNVPNTKLSVGIAEAATTVTTFVATTGSGQAKTLTVTVYVPAATN